MKRFIKWFNDSIKSESFLVINKGALTKTGELRHTRYWLNLEF